ncbi:MAG: hypothetical protein ACXWZL_05090 [Mycobacterium sp.]
MRLAERAGLHELLGQHLSVASPNAAVKAARGDRRDAGRADSFDDLDVLRHGGMRKVFGGVRAPTRNNRSMFVHIMPTAGSASAN